LLIIVFIYLLCIYVAGNVMETIIHTHLWVLLVQDRVAAMVRFNGSVGNLSLLTNRWTLLSLS
jgi:hypothetical protein